MNKTIKSVFLAGVISFNSVLLAADTIEVPRSADLTMKQLLNHVYQQQPELLISDVKQQQIAAHKILADAKFAASPVISLDHNNDVIGSSDGLQEWEGRVEVPLWLDGQQQQQRNLSQQLAAELPVYQHYLKLKASGLVREILWQVIAAEIAVKETHQQLERAKQLKQAVSVKIEAGELATADGILVDAHVIKAEQEFISTFSELRHAKQRYFRLTQQTTVPSDYQEYASTKSTIDNSHPYIAMQLQKIERLKAEQLTAKYADAEHSTLSIGVRRERGSVDESFNHSLGIGFSMPLDNTTYQKTAVADSAMAIADAEIELRNLKRQLTELLNQEQTELEFKHQQLDVLKKHYQTTQHYVEVQTQAFNYGEISLTELIRSQTLANESHLQLLRMEFDIAQTISEINQAVGLSL
jgi:outer membrane protein TolC